MRACIHACAHVCVSVCVFMCVCVLCVWIERERERERVLQVWDINFVILVDYISSPSVHST